MEDQYLFFIILIVERSRNIGNEKSNTNIMRIALNARHLIKDRLEGVGIVTDEVMSRIVRSHPEDQFDYYFDRKFNARFVHGPNVQGHAVHPVTRY
jgi:hypothetical protein